MDLFQSTFYICAYFVFLKNSVIRLMLDFIKSNLILLFKKIKNKRTKKKKKRMGDLLKNIVSAP